MNAKSTSTIEAAVTFKVKGGGKHSTNIWLFMGDGLTTYYVGNEGEPFISYGALKAYTLDGAIAEWLDAVVTLFGYNSMTLAAGRLTVERK